MLLEARHLAIAYGDAPAVWDASLEVGEGEVVAVIGPNGAGKSTLINAVAGLLRWRSGQLLFAGADLAGVPPHLVCRQGIALVPEGRRLFSRMSVEENLDLGCYRGEARRARAATLERVYALFPILHERRRQKAGTMSGGEQQMVAMGRALMTDPRLILLDEPSLGLAPKFVTLIFEKLAEMKRSGYTLMLVEQNATRALAIADRGYVLELGRNRFEGPGPQLLTDPEVKRLYLGG
jgi:branched-chain amino acid transport system ATP-binding protein